MRDVLYGKEYPIGKPFSRPPWLDRKDKENIVGVPTKPPTEMLKVNLRPSKVRISQPKPREVNYTILCSLL